MSNDATTYKSYSSLLVGFPPRLLVTCDIQLASTPSVLNLLCGSPIVRLPSQNAFVEYQTGMKGKHLQPQPHIQTSENVTSTPSIRLQA